MKTMDLAEGDRSVSELVELAKSEPVLVHAVDGTNFMFEEVDDFEREVATLGASEEFISFLEKRSREGKEIPASEVARRLGLDSGAK